MKFHFEHPKAYVWLVMVLLVALNSLCASGQDRESARTSIPKPAKRLVGDYSWSSKYQTPPYTAKQIPYSKLTHIIHFGVGIETDGSVYAADGFLEPDLIRKAHENGVKVLVAVCSNFAPVDDNPELTATFVANLYTFVNKYGYDGVDVDWEFPTIKDNSFYDLMAALRAAFPSPTYVISADMPSWLGPGNAFGVPQVDEYLDFFNIMMYDCAGPWTADGQLNSQIFWDATDPDPWECQPGGAANEAVADFLQVGVAPSQLNMGTPFYGYYYTDVSALFGDCPPADQTKDGNCRAVWTQNYGTYFKQRINKKGWETFYDPIAQVPYMLRTDGKPGFGTYDDEYSTYLRVWYSDWQWNLGGIFIWSVDADYDGQTQDLLDAAYAASFPPTN
jgi:chitinase